MMIQNRPHSYYMGEQQFASYLDHMIERIEDAREIEDSEMCEEKLRRIITTGKRIETRTCMATASLRLDFLFTAGQDGSGRYGTIEDDFRQSWTVPSGCKHRRTVAGGFLH